MKTFIVTSTAILEPIADELYPQYNSGYHTETRTEVLEVESEEEVARMFDDGECFKDVRWVELIKGRIYSDASPIHPNMVCPLRYSHYDKEEQVYVFDRLSIATRKKMYPIYLQAHRLNHIKNC